ncbi:MAG TPA: FHA domain-containing protein [Acidimicrobiales bacterium]|jgi:putative serine protease PepD|nr:FHA domain-containing protein [Acidimicrobiales bacterium]
MAADTDAAGRPPDDQTIEVAVGPRRVAFPAGRSVLLGRGSDVDVLIEDPTIGRHHATLSYADGTWTLIDSGSRNGTWIEDRRIDRMPLTGPVTIRLGAAEPATTVRITPAGRRTSEPAVAAGPFRTESTILLPGSTQGDGGATGRASAAMRPAPAAVHRPDPVAHATIGGDQILVVRSGDRQFLFPVGVPVRIGRDPSFEVVSTNPLVSRQQHGLLTSDTAGATYTDSSSRGTYFNGRRLTKPMRITESVTLMLGDPSTGEELGITPPLSADQIERNRRRRVTARRAKVAGVAVVVVALVAVGTVLVVANHGGGSSAGGLSSSGLSRAEAATVRLLNGTPADATASGSGTVISPDGLILTNGHVAAPQAPGEAVGQGVPGSGLDPNPPFLTVESAAGGGAVTPRYRARMVAVDGYLDLALVQIYSDASGRAVNSSSLHLPYLRLGDDARLRLDEAVTVLGFPGVTQSDSLTVTSGVISTFIPDALKHDPDPRFELETTARVAHGNSGGAAVDNAGDLIGVPSLTVQDDAGDVSWRLRPVSGVPSLLQVAQRGSGATYRTPWLVASTGHEQAQPAGWSTNPNDRCGGSTQVPSGPQDVVVGFEVAGIPKGLDLAAEALLPDGELYGSSGPGLPQITYTGGSCVAFALSADALGSATFPDGTYQVRLLGGPDLHPIGVAASDTVGSSS